MAGKPAPNPGGANMEFKEMKEEPNAPHVEYEQIKVKRGMLWIFTATLNLSLHCPFGCVYSSVSFLSLLTNFQRGWNSSMICLISWIGLI